MKTKQLIAEIEKGCGEKYILPNSFSKVCNGKKWVDEEGYNLCLICQSKLKGVLLGAISELKSELEFLGNLDLPCQKRVDLLTCKDWLRNLYYKTKEITAEINEYEQKLEKLK